MAPLIEGYLVASTMSNPSPFILVKDGHSFGLTITAVRSQLLNTLGNIQGTVQGESIYQLTTFIAQIQVTKTKFLWLTLALRAV